MCILKAAGATVELHPPHSTRAQARGGTEAESALSLRVPQFASLSSRKGDMLTLVDDWDVANSPVLPLPTSTGTGTGTNLAPAPIPVPAAHSAHQRRTPAMDRQSIRAR